MGFAKKAWSTLTTGWVVEYPNAERDFFDNRDRKVYNGQGRAQKRREGGKVEEKEKESNADACLRWSEQMKTKRSQEPSA